MRTKRHRQVLAVSLYPQEEADARYVAHLETLLAQAPNTLTHLSQRVKWVLFRLLEAHNGASLEYVPPSASVDVDALAALVTERVRGEMLEFVRGLIGDTEKMQTLNAWHSSGTVDEAALANVLVDWEMGAEV